ncbi:MAG: undecaprenyl/decaprenyl-phosphate alpha-N-acetylglucosaminyl 1-phosphate transferase [Acidobacteria bacterium]|nr:undecaprenyl/decaprenyl-phosphate alpha-N-acetylglucosaminyl 1-phosphate transferase [Acidobacteriota bacterium]
MNALLTLFVGAAISATALTFLVRAGARRLGSAARPGDPRPLHPTPRVGGIAIALTWVGAIVAVGLWGDDSLRRALRSLPIVPILAASLVVFLVGLADDMRPLTPSVKITLESLAAAALIGAGIVIHRVSMLGTTIDLSWLSVLVTLAWIIGITNAFNLVDGLDGLATGLAIIAGVTCTAIVLIRGETATAVLLVALLGALVGFLPFNFTRASIFLGDSGSLFIGFVLALTAITGLQKGATALAMGVPILIFALPLLDAASTIVRRLRGAPPAPEGRLRAALTHLVQPDREHIHHRLVSGGLSQTAAVLLLYGIAVCLAGLAFVLTER